ncbi:MAG: acyltransferase [Ruminococcaceae bacterium]|nr:acyltransferase [Oscillospiraceae bacterium]
MEQTKRNYSFDFLKIIASMGIVFFHFQLILGAKYDNFINFWGGWFNWGHLVELFFIISGYFMYHYIPVIQNGNITLAEWWKKRAVRLLPMAAITVVFFEIMLFLHKTMVGTAIWGMEISIWDSVVTMLGMSEGWVFENSSINASLWYVSALMFCYILFYIVTILSAKIKCNPMYFYIAIILMGIGGSVYGANLPFLNWQICRGYYAFFLGLLLSAYISKCGVKLKEIIVSAISAVIFVLLFIFAPKYISEDIKYIITFLFYPALIILCETNFMRKIFCHKIWGTLSGISFEVYLWHIPMILVLCFFVNKFSWNIDFNNVAIMFIFLGAMWIWGAVMHFFVERPITKLLTRNNLKREEKKSE